MKSVLVTGGAARIGMQLSKFFASKGWRVFVHYNKSEKTAKKLQKELRETGREVEIFQCDLRDQAILDKEFSKIFSENHINLLINNASVFEYDHPKSIDAEKFYHSMSVNLLSPIKISEIYYRNEKNIEGEKCIINILDNKLFSLNPDFYSYTLAKHALLSATKMQAMSFAPAIRVCGIAPSVTLPSGSQTQSDFERTHGVTLTMRGCLPKDICEGAEYIANTPIYNGQVLILDGGQSLINLSRDVAFLDE